MQLVLVVVLWASYGFVHSLLITPKVVDWMQVKLGSNYRYYRLGYNLIALLSLALPIYYTRSVGGPKILVYTGGWVNLYYFMVLLAIVVAGYTIFAYDWEEFIGFKQIRVGPAYRESTQLATTGALSYVRHPLYLAALLLLWAGDATLAQLLERLVVTLYILIGIYLEEQKLIARFGANYLNYQRQVPMLLPGVNFLRRWKGKSALR